MVKEFLIRINISKNDAVAELKVDGQAVLFVELAPGRADKLRDYALREFNSYFDGFWAAEKKVGHD